MCALCTQSALHIALRKASQPNPSAHIARPKPPVRAAALLNALQAHDRRHE
jgi:hypothetical protein